MNICRTIQLLWLFVLPLAHPSAAQVVIRGEQIDLTLEGYANATAGIPGSVTPADWGRGDDVRLDAALRALARGKNRSHVRLRAVVESSPENQVRFAEASLLIFGKAGRLELLNEPDLPDVLTGYAPNGFAFTGAEFGPASGPSLDPGGGLQRAFLSRNLAQQVSKLAVFGATARVALQYISIIPGLLRSEPMFSLAMAKSEST